MFRQLSILLIFCSTLPAWAQAQIGVAKNALISGRSVTLNFYIENLGDQDLTNISLPDGLDAVFGAGKYFVDQAPQVVTSPGTITVNPAFDGSGDIELITAGSLLVGESAQISVLIELTAFVDLGAGLGIYSNQVVVSAQDPGLATITDSSDHGTDPDPNGNGNPGDAGEDDPTLMDFIENPIIGVAKNASLVGAFVTLDFFLENFGDGPLSNLSLPDDLDAVFGAGNYTINAAPSFIADPGGITLNGAFDGSGNNNLIASGSLGQALSAQIRVVVEVTTVTDQGMGFGIFSNQVTAYGEAPNGASSDDLSDQGIDPDSDGDGNPGGPLENDATPIVIGEDAVIGVAKTAAVVASIVTFDFFLENLGAVTLSDLALPDDLNAVLGAGTFFISAAPSFIDDPGTLTLNPSFDGNFDTDLITTGSLTAGDTAQIRLVVELLEVTDQGLGEGNYENQVTVAGTAPSGGMAFDVSDAGTEPDPNGNDDPSEAGENDPTSFSVAELASIGVAKSVTVADFGGSPLITFRIVVENLGNVPITNITIDDDLSAVFGAGNFTHQTDPAYVNGAPSLTYNAAYNGSSNIALLTGGSLQPGESTEFTFASLLIALTDQGNGPGIYSNQVTVSGQDPDAAPVTDLSDQGSEPDPNGNGDPTDAGEDDATIFDANLTAVIAIAKAASVAINVVTLDFYLDNPGDSNLSDLDFIDNLDNVFGAGNYNIQTLPNLVVDPGGLVLNGSYDGSTDMSILDPSNSSLDVGQNAQIQMEVLVTQVSNEQALGLGNYSNQVTVTALSSQGGQISDTSHAGSDPDPNMDGDPAESDATLFALPVDSPIGVAKTGTVLGQQVTWDLFLENLGVSTLSSVSLTDSLDDAFGAGNYTVTSAPALIDDPTTLTLNGGFDGSADSELLAAGSTLASGATAQIQFAVTLTSESDQGFGAGIYQNQAEATGTQTNGLVVRDLSDSGTVPDPNMDGDPGNAGEDDATQVAVVGTAALGLALKSTVSGSLVTLDYTLENLGESTITNIDVANPLNALFGAGNYSVSSSPVVVSGATLTTGISSNRVVITGTLAPTESSVIRTIINVFNITDRGNGLGVYPNSVTVTGTDPAGGALADTSDAGTDPDPDGDGNPDEAGENDATVITMGDEALIGVAMDVSVTGMQATIDFFLENFGVSLLSNLSLANELDTVFGAANYALNGMPSLVDDPGTITLNPTYDGSADTAMIAAGSTLASLDTAQIQVVIDVSTIEDQGQGLGAYQHQVTVTANAPLGSSGFDISDFGTDPDPDADNSPDGSNESDPTTFTIGTKKVGVAKSATVNGRQLTLDYYVENLGNLNLASVSLPDNLDAVFGAGNYQLLSGPTTIGEIRNFVLNSSFDGSSDTQLIQTGSLSLGGTEQIQIVLYLDELIDMGSGLGVYSNQVTVTADSETDLSDSGTDPDPNGNGDPDDAGEDDPTLFTMPETPVIGVAKTVAVSGQQLTLDFYLENLGNVPLSNLSLPDDLDTVLGSNNYSINTGPSFVVDPGTITLNGAFDGSGDSALITTGTLAIDASAQIRLVVDVLEVVNQGGGSGIYSNQVSASATAPGGNSHTDLSDHGSDPDPNDNDVPNDSGEDDASGFTVIEKAFIGVAKTVAIIDNQATIDFFLENLGNTSFSNLVLSDDLDAVFGAGNYSLSSGPNLIDDPGSITLNGSFDGSGDTALISSGTLPFTESAQIRLVVEAHLLQDSGSGLGMYSNQVTVSATSIPSASNHTDQSDSGTDPDPNSNGDPGDAGEDDATDFSLTPSSIGDSLFNDLNGDGLESGEPGIGGVTVYADLNSNGILDAGEPSSISDGSGAYSLTGLVQGSYSIRLDLTTLPIGFNLTSTHPLTVILTTGEDHTTADFGMQQQDATIGDLVYNDTNGNGVFDGSDVGLAGVTVFIDANSNGTLDPGESSAVTDGVGAFDFTGLPVGTYRISLDESGLPDSFVLTGGSNPHVTTIAAGDDNNTADFGYQQQDASIGDLIFNDLDGNGVFDGGEPGIVGVTVYIDANSNGNHDGGETSLVSDGTGAYDFIALAQGNYTIAVDEATLPAGFEHTAGNNPQIVILTVGEDYDLADLGYQQQDASIGDLVYDDRDGNGNFDGSDVGLAGVTVFIDANSNGTLDGGEQSQVSDGSGAYDLTALATGTYQVKLDESTLPADYVRTAGTNPQTVILAAGEDNNLTDFGFQQQNASIGDLIYNDLDGNGFFDGADSGIAAVSVFLDLNGNGLFDGGEPILVSDGNGAYDFSLLPVGNYAVRVDETTLPSGFVRTTASNPLNVALSESEDYDLADFGYQQQNASIGDHIFDDLGGNGIFDGGDSGIAGVSVFLDSNQNGTLDGGEPSLVSDGTGAFDFTGLPLGSYAVTVQEATLPSGYQLTAGSNPHLITIMAGQDSNAADFGFQQQDASIGDLVYDDTNGDGSFEGSDVGLPAVTVFLDSNNNGNQDPGEISQVTDGSGSFEFIGLPKGTYHVRVDETTLASGNVLTGGSNPHTTTIVAGQDYNDADIGYQLQNASIGDLIYNDLDGNGVFDGTDFGIAGVTVFMDTNGNGIQDGGEQGMVSDGYGAYQFTGLTLGTYRLMVDETSVTTGFVRTGGSNPQNVTLVASEQNNSLDFGYQQQDASIGDLVYNDLDGNGVFDGSDIGIAGVTVYIDANANGNHDGGEHSEITDGAGAYQFTGLPRGSYIVRVDEATVTTGFVRTGGSNPQNVTLVEGEQNTSTDFGYQQQDASIGDLVYNDLDGNGAFGGDDLGLGGVTVYIDANGNGNHDGGEDSEVSDGAGAYQFTGLPRGSYIVRVDEATVTTGFVRTGGSNPQNVTLVEGEQNTSTDFGYQQQDASIGDLVYNDLDGNGAFDGDDMGLDGVTVYIDANANGNHDGGEHSEITDGAGAYQFTGLPRGSYIVKVDEATVTTGFVRTGGSNPQTVTLVEGEQNTDTDFGYQQQDASIGDLVYNDLDGNGVFDGDDMGLDGVTVYIDANSNGNHDGGEDSEVTDGAGAYQFTGLPQGSHTVRVNEATVTTGFVSIGDNPQNVTLVAGEQNTDTDFGYQQQDASFGDLVYNDLNGNGSYESDGDGGDIGIAGVTLYIDANGNGNHDGGEVSEVTDGAGAYQFTGLPRGSYSVMVDETTVTPGFERTGGSNPQSVTLVEAEQNNDIDFGYQQQDASIGDFVWEDLNGDQIQDEGEPGIEGITLYLDLNHSGSLEEGEPAANSDLAGAYLLADLATGTYELKVDASTVPSGYFLTTGLPLTLPLAAGENFNQADIGYHLESSVGDRIWHDLNGDGNQDAGEPGIAEVTLSLSTAKTRGKGGVVVATKVTNAEGEYDFTSLGAGTYIVTVTDTRGVLSAYTPSSINQTPLSVTLAAGQDNNDADFGYRLSDGGIGDQVFRDLNGNGENDGEPPIAKVTLDLHNAEGEVEQTRTTDAKGHYRFSGLISGTYSVAVTDRNHILENHVLTAGIDPLTVELSDSQVFDSADFGYCLPVTVTKQPQGATVCQADTITFSVTAMGSAPYSYQWRKDAEPIQGASGSSLRLDDILLEDAANYDCVLTNGCGTETTVAANLEVEQLGVSIEPRVAVQGLVPSELEASFSCEVAPLNWEWQIVRTGLTFGMNTNPVTLPRLYPRTTRFEISVSDPLDARATAEVLLLVSPFHDYADYDGDGCNTILDLQLLGADWGSRGQDPNNDGIIDVRDFLYINISGDCLPQR